MMEINLHDCEFLLSAMNRSHYPDHPFPEIAFVGRSNVGKSSLINALLNRKRLARTSGQPGRTQTINFYRVDTLSFVDLPGYGYAKVAKSTKEQWGPMIKEYLSKRENLSGIIQLVDIRHAPSPLDKQMTSYLKTRLEVPALVVATKADKLGRGPQREQGKQIARTLELPVVIFSAQTKIGVEQIWKQILDMINRGESWVQLSWGSWTFSCCILE